MSDPRGPLAIVGVGNVLFGDDGIGVHVVRAIRLLDGRGEAVLPHRTDLVEGGTLGRGLADVISSARALVIVDAGEVAGPPGTVAVVAGDAVSGAGFPSALGAAHGVGDVIDAARLLGTLPVAFSVVCIRPATIAPGRGLSRPVRAALETAISVTLDEARRLDRRAVPALDARSGRHLVGASA